MSSGSAEAMKDITDPSDETGAKLFYVSDPPTNPFHAGLVLIANPATPPIPRLATRNLLVPALTNPDSYR